jgi:DNA polymerase III subunit gamma/tau
MSHLVLARKYRPRNFDQVVGQELIVTTLKAAVEKNRVAHAMLFTGGRGIGKTTIARLVAKSLVCLKRKDAEPCGVCAQCQAIDDFSSLDVMEIDGASHTGVDDIRELRDSARYQPTSAKYKIFIIDEVHMLSINAFNALLKILEEPPLHVIFIFATTEAHKIPKTILSRCQRYDFKRVSNEVIFQTLRKIVSQEDHKFEDGGLRLIASLADGSLRDALSMTEQILSNGQGEISQDLVAKILGVVSHKAVKDICQALIDGEVTDALAIIKEVYEKGLDLCHLMDSLTERFRVLSLCAHVEENSLSTIIPSIDESDIDLVKNYDKADLKRLFAMSIDGIAQVFSAQKPLLALELFVLRTALRPPLGDAITINYCLQKLDAILHNRPVPKELKMPLTKKEKNHDEITELKTPKHVVELKQEDINAKNFSKLISQEKAANESTVNPIEPVHKNKSVIEDAHEIFFQLVNKLFIQIPSLANYLCHARPAINFGDKSLTLYFDKSLYYEQVLPHKNNEIFNSLVKDFFGCSLKINFELGKSTPPNIKTVTEMEEEKQKEEKAALYQKALTNPLVKKALEIFGGDITEVKQFNLGPREG